MSAARLLHFDCSSGLAGDMIVAALIDAGVPLEVVSDAVSRLPLSGVSVCTEVVERNHVRALRFVVETREADQPHRSFADIRALVAGSDLDSRVSRLALEIFGRLAEAEATVHGCDPSEVHFHEVGAVDSIVDIVGAAACLVHLEAEVSCGPVPLGRGFVETRHGTLPVPAPATLLVLRDVPVRGTEIDFELTTPTGAAVVRAAASRFGEFPAMIPERVGHGAGSRICPGLPGFLRAVIGTPAGPAAPSGPCTVVEANIDDMTGEVAAHAMERLLESGALDAWIEPIQMKKGRPALKLCVLCPAADVERLGALLMAETTTIGLRYHAVGRMESERETVPVETPWGPVRVKICHGPGGARNVAPEFEDCRALAREKGVPLKEIMAVALGLAQRLAR